MTRTCTKCAESKYLNQFSYRADSPTGLRSYCKTCESDLYKRAYVKRKYGITYAEYTTMVDIAGGCEICNSKGNPWLCVDHDHNTGKIRGILCNTCNSAIGMLGDTADKVQRAVKYLSHGLH